MTNHWNDFKNSDKLKSRTRKGIPNALRAPVWKKLADTEKYKKAAEMSFKGSGTYFAWLLTQNPDPKALSVINNDLNRTYPKHTLFSRRDSTSEPKLGQPRLYNVLCAYACYDREVG
eukprot:UN28269